MIKSFFRLVRSVFAAVAGVFNVGRRALDKNPEVFKAKYDKIIDENTGMLKELDGAVTEKVANVKRKTKQLSNLSESLKDKESLKSGAVNMIKKIKSKFSSEEELKASEEYIKAKDGFNSLNAEIVQITSQINALKAELDTENKTLAQYKSKLVKMERDVKNLRQEKHDAVADIVFSEHEKRINDTLRGIDTDSSAEELRELREQRDHALASAEVSAEMSGNTADVLEEEFRKYANENSSEFDELLGLIEVEKESQKETVKEAALPE